MKITANEIRDQVEYLLRDGYEIKVFEVNREYEPAFTSIRIETGRIGDEGTAASILCRTYAHLLIGPRDGLKRHSEVRSGAGNRWTPRTLSEAFRQIAI